MKGKRETIQLADKENAVYAAAMMFEMRDTDPDYAALLVRRALLNALHELRRTPGQALAEERYRKFRRMGEVESGEKEKNH